MNYRTPVYGLALGVLSQVLIIGPALASTHHSPVIHLKASSVGPDVHRSILGANMRWSRNADGLWNPATHSVYPAAITRARQVGMSRSRYPGGTVATMFDWKRAVTHSGCQIDGHWHHGEGFQPAPHSTDFGPNQFMRFTSQVGAKPIFMTPFVNQTPRDAADWVEYMNSPVGVNRNGGRDYARLRAATGHPKPYHVLTWEVGNESNVNPARYDMSRKLTLAIRQYAYGGVRHVHGEALGKDCLHPTVGVPSNGRRNQVFNVLFPAIVPRTLTVTVRGTPWHRVDSLTTARPLEHAYTVNLNTGDITFGDGRTHGAIPPTGAILRASYQNRYAGFFKFAQQMKRVDPRIRVCSSWGLPQPSFTKVAAGRHFDCQTAHPMTNPGSIGNHIWRTRLQGHDWMVGGVHAAIAKIANLRRQEPRNTQLITTEINAIRGNYQTFPDWSSSMSHALFMALMQMALMKQNVAWANGGDMFSHGDGAVLSDDPRFVVSAEAVEREAMLPMLRSNGHVIGAGVSANPIRNGWYNTYTALSTVAVKSAHHVFLMVVNRLPGRAVNTHVDLNGLHVRSSATMQRMSSANYWDYNNAGHRAVHLNKTRRTIGKAGFPATFPAHSLTVLELNLR